MEIEILRQQMKPDQGENFLPLNRMAEGAFLIAQLHQVVLHPLLQCQPRRLPSERTDQPGCGVIAYTMDRFAV